MPTGRLRLFLSQGRPFSCARGEDGAWPAECGGISRGRAPFPSEAPSLILMELNVNLDTCVVCLMASVLNCCWFLKLKLMLSLHDWICFPVMELKHVLCEWFSLSVCVVGPPPGQPWAPCCPHPERRGAWVPRGPLLEGSLFGVP